MGGDPDATEPSCREAIATEKGAHEARRSANFALGLLAIGILQLSALIGQIIALVLTIRQTRIAAQAAVDSVVASQRSAKAAEDAVWKSDDILAHAKEASRHELRAYVAPTRPILHTQRGSGRVHAEITLKNVGNTPASDLVCALSLSIGAWPQTSVVHLGFVSLMGSRDVTFMELWPTNEAVVTTNTAFSGAELKAVEASEKAIYLSGTIQYRDVFGWTQTTHFSRHKIGRDWRDGKPMAVSPKGNESISEKPK